MIDLTHIFNVMLLKLYICRADLYENDMVNELKRYRPWWEAEEFDDTFSTEEKNELQRLPNREYLLNDLERRTAFFGNAFLRSLNISNT